MSLLTGTYCDLTVERDSPFGYFLSDGEEDVLLHFSEQNYQQVKIGDKLRVFLYNDHKGRAAATLHTPLITLGETAFLEVKDYQAMMGFFLDNGLEKQILLPIADLPEDKAIWPSFGDTVLVKLVHDKQDRLLASLVKEEEDIQLFLEKRASQNPQRNLKMNESVEGIVLKHLSVGTHLYLENNQVGFLHRSEQNADLRLGQKLQVRVSFIREDGKLNLSVKPLKEESRIEDSERVLEILEARGGAMPYWDKTQPDIIMEKLEMSKAAFKRALGKLMKEGLVYQEAGWTYLTKQK